MDGLLDVDELTRFADQGFVVRPGFFAAGPMAAVRSELLAGATIEPYLRPGLGSLISHPPLMAVIGQLCGEGFLFHHLNASRHEGGAPGVPWHNDYEQSLLPMPRTHANVIVLIYPDGLRGAVGDLVVLPRTQHAVAAWEATSFLGTAVLPGEVVVDDLPPGSAVICHTGLLHCRRPRPGAGPRIFCDVSYVARGPRWPATTQHDWRAMYTACRRLHAHGGHFAHLFDDTAFFDPAAAQAHLARLGMDGIYRRLLGDDGSSDNRCGPPDSSHHAT
jgi:hypothetical protein